MTLADLLPSERLGAGLVSSSPGSAPTPSGAVVAPANEAGAGAPTAPVSFYIPTPPSVNQAYVNTRRGRAKSPAYTDWLMAARVQIQVQDIARIPGRVVVVMGFEREKHMSRADVDNRMKLTLDALVSNGVIDDDHMVTAAPPVWLPPSNGLAHIQIIPIQGGEQLRFDLHVSSDAATGSWVYQPHNQETGEADGFDV